MMSEAHFLDHIFRVLYLGLKNILLCSTHFVVGGSQRGANLLKFIDISPLGLMLNLFCFYRVGTKPKISEIFSTT